MDSAGRPPFKGRPRVAPGCRWATPELLDSFPADLGYRLHLPIGFDCVEVDHGGRCVVVAFMATAFAQNGAGARTAVRKSATGAAG